MPELAGSATIEVDDDFRLYELAAWSSDGLDTLLTRGSLPVPHEPGSIVEANGQYLLRITPRVAWLAVERRTSLDPAVLEADGVVVDLSSSRLRLRLHGNTATILPLLVAVDLAILPAASFVATIIHGIPVTILRSTTGYDLLVPRSFGRSLLEWVEDAALGYIASA